MNERQIELPLPNDSTEPAIVGNTVLPAVASEKLQARTEELRSYNVSNRYVVGYDSVSNGSQQTYVLWDRQQNKPKYITKKKWKVKFGLIVAILFLWERPKTIAANRVSYE